jgi:DNA-binding beta-propeller fold protein YncE
LTELYRSVSQFNGKGQAISPSTPAKTPPYGGWRSPEANISQPQGTVSDTFGNIWIGNCGNASITKLANGQIGGASNFMPVDEDGVPVLSKPFGVTVDPDNRVWVASNNNDRVVAFNQDGSLYKVLADPFISFPMGVASDATGNMWIANSGAVRPSCEGDTDADRLSDADAVAESPIPGASVSVYLKDTGELHAPPFRGGWIFMPWGIAFDGNNDVWVANFAGRRSGLIGVTQLCGIGSSSCPAGQYRQPISPATGYTSNGMERITGVSIDASGNVWLANNWLRDIDLKNPGGHQLVVFLGLAAPIKMPLIGPPESP